MSSAHQHRMRFGGSPIISIVLCVIALVLLYFYWSSDGRLKSARNEIASLKDTIKLLDDEKERVSNRLSVLSDDLKKENRMKREIETKARGIKVQLDEAQMKLQAAESRVTEFQSQLESVQGQLESKTEENDQLTQQDMEKDSKIEDCHSEKDRLLAYNNEVESAKSAMKLQVDKLHDQVNYLNGQLATEQQKSRNIQNELALYKSAPPQPQQQQQFPPNPQNNYAPHLPPVDNTQLQYSPQPPLPPQQPPAGDWRQPPAVPSNSLPQGNNDWENQIFETGKNHLTMDQTQDGDNHPMADHNSDEMKVDDSKSEDSDNDDGENEGNLLLDEGKKEGDYDDGDTDHKGGPGQDEDEKDQPANLGDDNEGGPPADDYGNNLVNNDNGDNAADEEDEKDEGKDAHNQLENNDDDDHNDVPDDKANVLDSEEDNEHLFKENNNEDGLVIPANDDHQQEEDEVDGNIADSKGNDLARDYPQDHDDNQFPPDQNNEDNPLPPDQNGDDNQFPPDQNGDDNPLPPDQKPPDSFGVNNPPDYDHEDQLEKQKRSLEIDRISPNGADFDQINRFDRFSDLPGNSRGLDQADNNRFRGYPRRGSFGQMPENMRQQQRFDNGFDQMAFDPRKRTNALPDQVRYRQQFNTPRQQNFNTFRRRQDQL